MTASLLSLVVFLALVTFPHGGATLARALQLRGSAQSTGGTALVGEDGEEAARAAQPPAPPRDGSPDREEAKEADESSSDDDFSSGPDESDGYSWGEGKDNDGQPIWFKLKHGEHVAGSYTSVNPNSPGGREGKNAAPEQQETGGEEKIGVNVLFLGGENVPLEFPRHPSPTIGHLRSKLRAARAEEQGQFRDIRLFAPPSGRDGGGCNTEEKCAGDAIGTGDAIGDDDLEIESFFGKEEAKVFFALMGASWWGRHIDGVSSSDMWCLKLTASAIAAQAQFQNRVIHARRGEYQQYLMFAVMVDEEVHRAVLGYSNGSVDMNGLCAVLGAYWNMRDGFLIDAVTGEISTEVARELVSRGFVDFARVESKKEIKDHVRVEDVVTVLNSEKVRAFIDEKIACRNEREEPKVTLTRGLLPNEEHMELTPKFVRLVVNDLHELADMWKTRQDTRQLVAGFLGNEAISRALEPIFVAEDRESIPEAALGPVPKRYWFGLMVDERKGLFRSVGLLLVRFQDRLDEPETPGEVADKIRYWWAMHGEEVYERVASRGEAALAALEEIGKEWS